MKCMPMTRRELKKAMIELDCEHAKLMGTVDTRQWLGIADAHIATPELSLVCALKYHVGRIFGGGRRHDE